MNLNFQQSCIQDLQRYKNNHSIIIAGAKGTGKSYLASQYAKMHNILDFAVIDNSVASIRDTLEVAYQRQDSSIVYCIENLDLATKASSNALLKFLEEPSSNVYIIVTVRNLSKVADTIISRAVVTEISHINEQDIAEYAHIKDGMKYEKLHTRSIWKAIHSMSDIDYIFNLTDEKIDYIEKLNVQDIRKKSVYDSSWALTKFTDNSKIDMQFMLQYLLETNRKDKRLEYFALDALASLNTLNIADFVILQKFLMDYKYTAI